MLHLYRCKRYAKQKCKLRTTSTFSASGERRKYRYTGLSTSFPGSGRVRERDTEVLKEGGLLLELMEQGEFGEFRWKDQPISILQDYIGREA